ncbi:GGDEF domain-containing protein [Devosia oryziradicis]|uniref:diguanylate cyclase n=1 Tax=Devosia oryziradicis TaxID=2801335 RepID=A0ABX7C0D3_9HYPH|nr:GGDEF domain-containing protein [Devosia oryziradicis]QQR37521.1 GGDEF domain-containing protein [Devosia oryziradicis]
MPLDQLSLLTAIAFSSAALTITLFVGWLGARRDTYLLNWSIGLMLVVAGVVMFGLLAEGYDPTLNFASFALTQGGFAFIYAGAIQFRAKPVPMAAVAIIGLGLIGLTGVAFLAGLSGLGTIFANLSMALLMALCAREYWCGRSESPMPMTANAALYAVSAISFVLCAAVLLSEQRWVMTAQPRNWAEDINSIVLIVGITGIGAISLTLNQSRWARHHRSEAMTDSLTGLLNRRALFDSMKTTLPPGAAVIMFDLDHFKSINDQLGHAAGDAVLEGFAALVKADLRRDDIAARLGGEEFCLVLPDLTKRSASGVAERIRAGFEAAHFATDRGIAETTLSAGVAISSIDGEPFEAVLKRADDALYAAKAAGRNRVHAPAPRLVA